MKKRIILLLSLILPVMLSAHPGHTHGGSTIDVLTHFLTTYWYAYLIPAVLLILYFVYRRKEKQNS